MHHSVVRFAIHATAPCLALLISQNALSQQGKRGRIEIADAQVSLIQNTFVAAPIAGIAAKVFVVEGDRIQSGRPLLQLDTLHTDFK